MMNWLIGTLKSYAKYALLIALLFGGFWAYEKYDKANNYEKVTSTIKTANVQCYLQKKKRISRRRKEIQTSPKGPCDIVKKALATDAQFEGFKLKQETVLRLGYSFNGADLEAQITRRDGRSSPVLKAGDTLDVLVEKEKPTHVVLP